MFEVGRSTCPQCLDSGVSSIQRFYLYADVSTKQMHYAWQAGVRRSIFSLFWAGGVSYEDQKTENSGQKTEDTHEKKIDDFEDLCICLIGG
jgi:hypothetical protein